MDAKVGGYGFVPAELDGAIVSSHYYLFEVDTRKLHPAYLEVVSQAEILQQQIVAKGSTNYSSIRPGSVLEWKIPLPVDLDVQKQIARNFQVVQSKLSTVGAEITHQQTLLTKLKQAILQEAIQGKMTADWRKANPDVEPASKLLERIKLEKDKLIKDKKLRPEKPLPPIAKNEIPFEIPKGWEWCRLGDINMKFLGGEAYQSGSILPSGINQVVRIGNIKPDTLELSKRPAFISDSLAEETSASLLQPGDILVTMTGTYQKKDYCFTVLLTEEYFGDRRLYQNQRVGCFRLHPEVHKPFLIRALKLVPLLDPVFESSTGAANQANISKGALLNILIPLPPLAEQVAIVERVEALMTTCRTLEAEIEHARTNADQLLQSVLKEAFTPSLTNV